MRRLATIATCAGLAATSLALVTFEIPALLVYNGSPSVPVGFYLRALGPAVVGDYVTVRIPHRARRYAAARGFADRDDRFIKRLVADAQQTVCAHGADISLDGQIVAARATHDLAGRPLPSWEGCVRLGDVAVFLLGDSHDSFDGRYWGPTNRSDIDGVWTPLAQPPRLDRQTSP